MRSVESAKCELENKECGKPVYCGVWRMKSVESVERKKCGVLKVRSVG